MNDLIFYKDLAIMLILAAAFVLHTAGAIYGFFFQTPIAAKISNTAATLINIILHIVLIAVMMYKGIALDEAVLVMMISLFYHTLLYFIYYSAKEIKEKKRKEKAERLEKEAVPVPMPAELLEHIPEGEDSAEGGEQA